MKLIPVIGLETHIQLNTKTKMFCRCLNGDERAAPNTNLCPICAGHPGTLPTINQQAIAKALTLAKALKGRVAEWSKFDRKNYFYPDLPKAYQITQFDLPIMEEGEMTIEIAGKPSRTIRIERMHLEEDAAKNIHGIGGKTLVDFNRAGAPLCEIVTRPDFKSAEEAKAYLQEMRLLVRMLDVGGGDLEKGQMRCDVNISLREVNDEGEPVSTELSPKTEIKNINSFRAVERAINFEIKRQTELWEAGQPPAVITTRGWNDETQETEEQRTKENSADYRYFPEPDLPPINVVELQKTLGTSLPELPWDKRRRFVEEYDFSLTEARFVVDDLGLSRFAEAAISELGGWLEADPNLAGEAVAIEHKRVTRTLVGWLTGKLLSILDEEKLDLEAIKLTPENFAEFVYLIAKGEITNQAGLLVLKLMVTTGVGPKEAIEATGAKVIGGEDELAEIIQTILNANPKEYERYKAGETKLFAFFLGQVMRATKGNAAPEKAREVLEKILTT